MRGVEQIPWVYDAMCSLLEATGLSRWRRWLTGGAQGLTLEVGSGTGRNLPLYPVETQVVAVEPSLDTLRRSRSRTGARVALVRASAEDLPFRDGTFETVVSGLVFCSVPDPLRGLAEVRRVLKDEGQLRMLEHVRSTSRIGAGYQDLIQPTWTRVAGGCHPNRDTEANVTAAGLRIDPLTLRAKGNLRRFVARKG